MALGAGETTLLRLTNAYAMLDNGGHWLVPSVIDTVQDRNGRVIYQKGIGGCPSCFVVGRTARPTAIPARCTARSERRPPPRSPYPARPGPRTRSSTSRSSAVRWPTRRPFTTSSRRCSRSSSAAPGPDQADRQGSGQPLAGKTGTTSNYFDAWFVGFSPDLVAGTYVGFDEPRTLGDGETGGHVAAPIFRDFMTRR